MAEDVPNYTDYLKLGELLNAALKQLSGLLFTLDLAGEVRILML